MAHAERERDFPLQGPDRWGILAAPGLAQAALLEPPASPPVLLSGQSSHGTQQAFRAAALRLPPSDHHLVQWRRVELVPNCPWLYCSFRSFSSLQRWTELPAKCLHSHTHVHSSTLHPQSPTRERNLAFSPPRQLQKVG